MEGSVLEVRLRGLLRGGELPALLRQLGRPLELLGPHGDLGQAAAALLERLWLSTRLHDPLPERAWRVFA